MRLLRYPAYRTTSVSWLSEVPEGWVVARLQHTASVNDDVLPESTEPEFALEYVDIGSVSLEHGIERTEQFTFSAAPSRARRLVRDGDVLISTVRTYLKAIAPVVSPPDNMVVSTGFAVIRPRPGTAPAFAKYVVQAPGFVDEVIARSTGVSYPAINASELVRIPIPLPPLSGQLAIAAFLDHETAKIDGLIAEQEKLIALLAEKRQATISHAVTRGLNPQAPMKDSGVPWLGEVPAHWRVARVKALSEFTTSGPRGWSERIVEDGSLFIQSGDLNDSLGLEYETAKRVNVGDDAEAARTRLAEGDVVICITGAKTGNVALCSALREPAYVNQHLCLIRPTAEVHGRFLAYALKSTTGQLQLDLSQYGLKQGLSLEGVREVWVVYPSRDEQEDIVARLDAAMARFKSLVTAAEDGVRLLRERRSALIAAAVTGQIDVRGTTPRGQAGT